VAACNECKVSSRSSFKALRPVLETPQSSAESWSDEHRVAAHRLDSSHIRELASLRVLTCWRHLSLGSVVERAEAAKVITVCVVLARQRLALLLYCAAEQATTRQTRRVEFWTVTIMPFFLLVRSASMRHVFPTAQPKLRSFRILVLKCDMRDSAVKNPISEYNCLCLTLSARIAAWHLSSFRGTRSAER